MPSNGIPRHYLIPASPSNSRYNSPPQFPNPQILSIPPPSNRYAMNPNQTELWTETRYTHLTTP